jgi:hypothetical protein
MHNPFRYFKASPEIIRLAVMMYVRPDPARVYLTLTMPKILLYTTFLKFNPTTLI